MSGEGRGERDAEFPSSLVTGRLGPRELWRHDTARALLSSTAVTAIGNGAFIAVSFLYYTRVQGTSAHVAGVALSVIGLSAAVVTVAVGQLLERVDSGVLNAVLLIAQAGGVVGLVLARPMVPLLGFVAVVALVSQVKLAARGALIARGVEPSSRVAVRAWLRTISNVGIGVGSAVAGLAVAVDEPWSYRTALLIVAVCYLLGAVPLLRLRGRVASVGRAESGPRFGAALRDWRYVGVVLLTGMLGIHYLLIEVGLPQWVSESDRRPLWLVAAALGLNTVVIALGQVPLSRFVSSVRSASYAIAFAGGCFLLACLLIFGASGLGRVAGSALVLGAVVLYSVGEILHSTGSWELSFELAPADRMTEYQGLFAAGLTLGTVAAPAAITSALGLWGDVGWAVIGLALALLAVGALGFRNFKVVPE